jgi:uncharacterized membrane protein
MSEPISMYVPAALVGALSVPLALKLVPPNRIYGVRTPQTLASREVWFRVNRVAGFALIVAVGMAMCVYLAEPEWASGRSFLGVLALIVPVVPQPIGGSNPSSFLCQELSLIAII